jgi:glycosyltransferase involved in cell wall biosynthesis
MKILFVYGNMYDWGGIQTLLVRLAPRLRALGHDVSLLTRPRRGPWDVTSAVLDQIAASATVHVADDNWLKTPRRALRSAALGPADVIVACDLRALMLTSMIQRYVLPGAGVVAAVFAPREYCWKRALLHRPWLRHLSTGIIRRVPLENLMFATDGMVRQTGDCAGRDLTGAPVLPLTIDTQSLRQSPHRRIDRRKIVSVARLAPYYTHHREMVGVIRELRGAGHDFSYHVYGEGPESGALEAEAHRLGVADALFLHGAIPYERFAEAVSDAFAYIGLGTALIEAAACGVPALVAIDSIPRPVCYGFIQDTTGNDIGGYVPGHREYPIAERIRWLADLPEDQYREVAERSRQRAEEFDTSVLVPRFVEILHDAGPVSLQIPWRDRQLARAEEVAHAALWKLGLDTSTTARHLGAHGC